MPAAAPLAPRRTAEARVRRWGMPQAGMISLPDDELDRFIREDVPYGDLTTRGLGLSGRPAVIAFRAGGRAGGGRRDQRGQRRRLRGGRRAGPGGLGALRRAAGRCEGDHRAGGFRLKTSAEDFG